MPTAPIAVELDTRALKAFRKRVERYQGLPLARRMERGALDAAKLLVPSVRAAAPKGPTGNLKRSIKARQVRTIQNGLNTTFRSGVVSSMSMSPSILAAWQGQIATAFVGPSSRIAPHRHLVIRGHAMVGHRPNKVDAGRVTGNPFVDSAVQPRAAEAMRVVRNAIFGGS